MSDLLLLLLGLLAGGLMVTAALLPSLRATRATAALLERELAAARAERNAIEADLRAAQEAADVSKAQIDAENAALRIRMDEVADMIMRREGAPRATSAEEA